MSNVLSIYSSFNEIEILKDQSEISHSLKDFADEWLQFLNILTLENNNHLNNIRWFSSKELIVCGMAMLMVHQKLLQELIQEYKNKHGFTEIIKKTESAFEKMIKGHKKTLRFYEHLIDLNQCEKQIFSKY